MASILHVVQLLVYFLRSKLSIRIACLSLMTMFYFSFGSRHSGSQMEENIIEKHQYLLLSLRKTQPLNFELHFPAIATTSYIILPPPPHHSHIQLSFVEPSLDLYCLVKRSAVSTFSLFVGLPFDFDSPFKSFEVSALQSDYSPNWIFLKDDRKDWGFSIIFSSICVKNIVLKDKQAIQTTNKGQAANPKAQA